MIKERIIQLIEYKGIAKENFYVKIGMTSASFRGKAKESPLNSNAIENILSEIPDVNIEWLLTGKGSMLKQPEEPARVPPDQKDQYIIDLQRKHIEKLEEEIEQLKKEKEHTFAYGMVAEPKQELKK